jgi:phage repressor protein C with HTH and peptisase S24 domain
MRPDNQRFVEACQSLVAMRKAKSLAEIARLHGKTSQYFTDLKGGKSNYSREFLDFLSEKFGVNKIWVITGEGYMFDTDATDLTFVNEPMERYEVKKKNKGVPYYDIDVTASNIESFSDMPEVAEYTVDFKPFNDCIAMLPIVGDSMYPEFKNGDIIAIKEAPTTHFMFGETHLVITKEGFRTVKKLRKHPQDDKVILKPVNPNYDETEIKKEDILKLYLVKGQFKTHSY